MKNINKEFEEIALNNLEEVDCGDTEIDHALADKILCELLIKLGYQKVVDRYNKINKWYA